MKTIHLRPIRERDSDFDEIERRIIALFRKLIYVPIMKELGVNTDKLANSANESALARAIHSGQIVFWQGSFTGKFSSAISRELRELGARYDRPTKSYKLQKRSLPYAVQSAISTSEDRFARQMEKIDETLTQKLGAKIGDQLKVSELFDRAIWRTDRELKSTLRSITVAPKLSPEQASRISKEWERNLQLYIQEFSEKEIFELRAEIKKAVFTGKRYEEAIGTIQKSYGVTRRKAKFLARQETSLLMTKFKQTRYEDAGVREYKWVAVAGSPAHPVRPRHKELADESAKGRIFRWDTPPITTEAGEPARHNNPGQDYNCRCYAIPIVRMSDSREGKQR